jgi:hypothetical protein
MEAGTKKKLMAAVTAALAAFAFGESQIMGIEERLKALEDIHPELKQEELDELAEELQSEEEAPPALGKPGMSAPPIEDPEEKPEEEGDPEEE